MNFNNVLFISPHTDDSEIGAGGLMNKLLERGSNIYHYALSDCIESVPTGLDRDTLRNEFYKSCNFLSLKDSNYECFSFEVRKFNQYRQEILELLIRLRSSIKPDLVVCPSLNDFHQDHNVVAYECLRAFKTTNLIHYEMPWNMTEVKSTLYVELDEELLGKKFQLISNYESQMNRSYINNEIIKSLALIRGASIGKQYAEMFEVSRWII